MRTVSDVMALEVKTVLLVVIWPVLLLAEDVNAPKGITTQLSSCVPPAKEIVTNVQVSLTQIITI
jgi:hypothetical protein